LLNRFDDARVVIIDGAPDEAAYLESLLQRAGIRRVHHLSDPGELLDRFHRLEPDLVVLDLQLPGVDGLTLLSRIVRRAAGTYVPVLALTSGTVNEAPRRALSIGARDYLPRPLNSIDVLLRVGNLLETRHLHQQLRRLDTSLAAEVDRKRRLENLDPQVRQTKCDLVLAALAGQAFQMVFQPVVDLFNGTTLGHEALARFDLEPARSPNEWFADAADVGLGYALELAAVSRALDVLPHLPPGGFLSVNVSAETLLHPNLLALADTDVAPRLVLELTEQLPVEDYGPVVDALAQLRARGARLAVDDTGSGFASMRHIRALSPDLIKLDMSLVRGIDHDPVRRALARAMVAYAADAGTQLLAKGVETPGELNTLKALEVRWAQGYLLGQPEPLVSQRTHLTVG
jgi:EAL domain-containing protein (putative c-di-GMP-specific phosphodiesterase class I)/AmiR/NasT family two-component response regulator